MGKENDIFGEILFSAENNYNARREIILKEWEICERTITNFDQIGIRIRTWATTLLGGALFFSIKDNAPEIALIAIPVLLIFWFVDALYRSYQENMIKRVAVICEALRHRFFGSQTDKSHFVSPFYEMHYKTEKNMPDSVKEYARVSSAWRTSVLTTFLFPHVALTYLGSILACLVTYGFISLYGI